MLNRSCRWWEMLSWSHLRGAAKGVRIATRSSKQRDKSEVPTLSQLQLEEAFATQWVCGSLPELSAVSGVFPDQGSNGLL